MSLRAIIEVALHLESFRNIDLFQQGLYYLQFQVSHSVSGQKFSASPYNLYYSQIATMPGKIIDIFYNSQILHIKYYDENIEINEIVTFRTEIEVDYDFEVPALEIECSLRYLDVGGRISDKKIKEVNENLSEFVQICSEEISVINCIDGASQFLPIVFDDQHFSVANCTIHTILLDFRFRPMQMIANELIPPLSLLDAFFPAGIPLTPELIDAVHSKYIQSLLSSHKRVSDLIQCWTPGSKPSFPIQTHPESFSQRVKEPSRLAECLLLELQELAGNMHYLLYTFIETLKLFPRQITLDLMHKFNILLRDKWGESIFKKVTIVDNFALCGENNLGALNKSIAKSLRASQYYRSMERIQISASNYFLSPELHPILFLDVASKVKSELEWAENWVKYSHKRVEVTHLIVFVHGFQGSSMDVRLIKNQVALCRPDTLLMCSYMNEGETEGDILSMGERLSEEIHEFILQNCPKSIDKISFIGHSLGGLIIRACLPYLKNYSAMFHFFLTFSSPHLGYMYNSSRIIDAGLWIIKKWRKSECLKQLTMTDDPDPRSCFLYSLSNAEGLEWFKHVGLVGAHQDNYAPFESARVEVGQKAENDSKGRLYIEMANNLLLRITAERLIRVDVNLKLKGKTIDNLIGRAAHIQMLDNHILIQMVMHCCAHFFN